MFPATANQRRLRTLYCNLMMEAKLRLLVIDGIFTGEYKVPHRPGFELCYLQLRMICEIIALGSVALHGDIPAVSSAKFRDAYEADWILKRLESLHPTFYPEPGFALGAVPDGAMEFAPMADPYMTKADLLKLYFQCGEILHRGTSKKLAAAWDEPDFLPVMEASSKIVRLLTFHRIAFVGGEFELWVWLNGTTPVGKVEARLIAPR
jgi:hypothetical protein